MSSIDELIKSINNTLKYEAVIDEYEPEYVLSSGIVPLDEILGGFPAGKIYEIAGLEGTGKSSLMLQIIKTIQQEYPDMLVVYFDAENSFDEQRANMLGINTEKEKILVLYVDYIEDVFMSIKTVLNTVEDKYVVFFIDSLTALPSKQEYEGGFYKQEMGSHARAISKAFKLILNTIRKHQSTLFVVNQLRQNVDPFGKKYITTGGKSIDYYTSISLMLKTKEHIKDGDKKIGKVIVAEATKNKLNSPHIPVKLYYFYDKGFDEDLTLLKYMIDNKIIKSKNGWITYKEKKYRIAEFLKEKRIRDVYKEIKEDKIN